MVRDFEIVAETEIEGTPQQVFDAVTAGTSGWLWPMAVEPRLGGAGPFGSTVTAWEPPHHFANHLEGEDGFYNRLDYRIEERPGGASRLHYTHSGVFAEDWDTQYRAAVEHTGFYQHTLGEYVKYFSGRQAAFAEVQGPQASGEPNALAVLRARLGIPGRQAGEEIRIDVAGIPAQTAVVDYLAENFLGLRTPDALYRIFGRNAFGSVVGLTIHLFAVGADAAAAGAAWQAWLEGCFEPSSAPGARATAQDEGKPEKKNDARNARETENGLESENGA